jgi:hypothetical protein
MTLDESLHELGLESHPSERDLLAAAERLVASYEDQARGGDVPVAAYRGLPLPSPQATLATLFLLHEAARMTEARRLERALAAWHRTRPRADEKLDSAAKAWRWARDLGALSDALSPEVRRALAYASRIGDLGAARRPLRAFAMVDRRLLADAELLRQSGGAFVAHADDLDPPDAIASASRTLAASRSAVAVGGALIAFVVGLVFMGRSDRGPAPTEELVPPIARAGPDEEAIEAVARLRSSLGDSLQDQQARAITRALTDHDCGTALERVDVLKSGGPYGKTQSLVDAVAAAVLRACSKASPRASAARDTRDYQ